MSVEFDVRNPADGRVVGHVPDQSADDVAAVEELRRHQPDWETLGPKGRTRWLGRLCDWLFDHTDEVADLLQAETSKPRSEARSEMGTLCDVINYWSSNAAKFLSSEHPSPHSLAASIKRLTQTYRPYPVVGVISPWNFSLLMPGMDTVPALAAGAAVIVKPSEATPLSRSCWPGPGRRSAHRHYSRSSPAPGPPAPPWSTTSTSSSSPARRRPAGRSRRPRPRD